MPSQDPNGIDWPAWKRYGYASYETYVSSKAGAGFEAPNHETTACQTCAGSGLVGELQDCRDCAGAGEVRGTVHPGDHPNHLTRAEQLTVNQMPPQPPRAGPDPHLDPNWLRATHFHGEWPQPQPPPYQADDENQEKPDA